MIGEKLREIRENTGLNKKEFAQYLGLKYTTYNNYETEAREPASDFLILISEKFDVSIDYLLGLKDESTITHSYQLKPSEYTVIEKYRFISKYSPDGTQMIDTVLDREYTISEQFQKQEDRIKELESHPATVIDFREYSDTATRAIQYFHSVSAGTGQVIFDDVFSERISIPDVSKYRRVAYAVKVSGCSMEPLYNDGDMLLIEPTCEINVGENGIFNVGGQAYVKKLGETELISLNKGYDNIPLTEDARCMGRVVDKYKID